MSSAPRVTWRLMAGDAEDAGVLMTSSMLPEPGAGTQAVRVIRVSTMASTDGNGDVIIDYVLAGEG